MMEVLITFMQSSSSGSFLGLLAPGQDVLRGLTAMGAPPAFIETFMVCVNTSSLVKTSVFVVAHVSVS